VTVDGGADATVSMFGFEMHLLSLRSAVESVVDLAQAPAGSYIVTMNADHVVKLNKNQRFRDAYRSAGRRFVDGMPVYWIASRRAGIKPGRVAGSEMLPLVLGACERRGLSVYIFGGNPDAQARSERVLRQLYPSLRIVGWESTWVDVESSSAEFAATAQQVIAQRPDVVVVALGAPKQEYWAHAVAPLLGKGCILPIGAGLDFLTGDMPRAPALLRSGGMEWAWRLALEPRRLGRRYIQGNLLFIWLCIRTALGARALSNDGRGGPP
jgi:N-acetylglucosaminyldiphosphoundecaprenol N-acetyl-beta-D-mannosaminyltransferase